jgi:hypothetical protein
MPENLPPCPVTLREEPEREILSTAHATAHLTGEMSSIPSPTGLPSHTTPRVWEAALTCMRRLSARGTLICVAR